MRTDNLYDVALTHFAAAGVDAVSLPTIAAAAGLPVGEIAIDHPTVDGLFEAAVGAAVRELGAELEATAEEDRAPAERLIMMMRRLASPTQREGMALFAVLREILDGNPRAAWIFESCLRDGFDAFIRVLGESQFRGDIKPLPPRFVVTVLLSGIVLPQILGFGGVEGVLHGVHADADDSHLARPPRSALLAASIEALCNGIATRTIDLTESAFH